MNSCYNNKFCPEKWVSSGHPSHPASDGPTYSFHTDVKRLSESKKRREDYLMSSAQLFYGLSLQLVAHLLAAFPGICHSSTRPGTSYHMTQFYQAFPRISTASEKRWGEKAWVRG